MADFHCIINFINGNSNFILITYGAPLYDGKLSIFKIKQTINGLDFIENYLNENSGQCEFTISFRMSSKGFICFSKPCVNIHGPRYLCPTEVYCQYTNTYNANACIDNGYLLPIYLLQSTKCS